MKSGHLEADLQVKLSSKATLPAFVKSMRSNLVIIREFRVFDFLTKPLITPLPRSQWSTCWHHHDFDAVACVQTACHTFNLTASRKRAPVTRGEHLTRG